MLRYKTEIRLGLVDLYDIRPRNGAGPFLQPWSQHMTDMYKKEFTCVHMYMHRLVCWLFFRRISSVILNPSHPVQRR